MVLFRTLGGNGCYFIRQVPEYLATIGVAQHCDLRLCFYVYAMDFTGSLAYENVDYGFQLCSMCIFYICRHRIRDTKRAI